MILPMPLSLWVPLQTQVLDESKLDCQGCQRFVGKCCTFQPFVANFNVGALATHPNYFSSPLGLMATNAYQRRHRATSDGARGMDLICSFYDGASGGCKRWNHRPAECAAYFCESTHGAKGDEFWRAFSEDLNALEVAVAQMAMVEFGFSPRVIGEQITWIARAPEVFDPRVAWGDWYGFEQEYLDRCAAWARSLSREEVQGWLVESCG